MDAVGTSAATRRGRLRRFPGRITAVLFMAFVPVAPREAEGMQLDYSGSLGFTRGDYVFTEPTETFTLTNGLSWHTGRLRLSASIPAILQDTRAITIVGGTVLPTGGPDHGAVSRRTDGEPIRMGQGRRTGAGGGGMLVIAAQETSPDTVEGPGDRNLTVGDPLLSGTVELYSGFDAVRGIDVLLALKPPVAKLEDGVGTGEWDYGAGLGVTLGAGRLLFMADATWWRYGDLAELELRDGLAWSATVGVPVTSRVSALLGVWGAGRVIEGVEAPVALNTTLGIRAGEGRSFLVGGSIGLTESTAAFSVYAGARTRLFGVP
ncbi:MAG TPA: hypothetical protein VK849_03105 [Longimicrobiales bacterium]|nr:hypothetical protein [Longimicrobiales bacterium]